MPIFRGQIYYTPENEITDKIMRNMNKTFENFEEFRDYAQTFGSLYSSFRNIEYYTSQSKILTILLSSKFFEELAGSKINEKFDFDFNQMKNKNVSQTVQGIKDNLNVFETINQATRSMSCFQTNRITPAKDESDFVSAAENGTLLAGIVLMDRFANNLTSLDPHIQYKIRMDVDKVPITSSLKERMWVPGPDGDMYYNMRYFWGFIQVQDMLDNAIMEAHQLKDSIGVYLQQFPYPCFRRDNFNSGLYTAQLIQVTLVFGYSLVVGLSVREFLWERESKNIQLMRIMGVKYKAILLANFIFLLFITIINSACLTMILYFGTMLPYSNPIIVFLILLSFGVANIMFIFLLSLVLKKSSSGSVSAFLLFIVTFLPFIILVSLEEQVSTFLRVLSNLLMTTSFGSCFLYITRYEQRGEGLQWNNYMKSPIEDDELSCFYCHLILMLDSCLYFILAILISKFAAIDGTMTIKKTYSRRYSNYSLENQNTKKGIHLSGLKKIYRIDRKHKRVAVDIDELVFAENEITGLLGHNGAGKSTTMLMMTGLEIPTDGNIFMNNDAKENVIGFCPQHSILYDNMTVGEHLEFYANLKDHNKNVKEDVKSMMNKMKITSKVDTLSKNLSEGLRRRLSVGIAFIGNSRVVILDEPTSGVDPDARKDIWNLITSYKQNRTIVVSTHYIDEAELLCDNIVIMHKGRKVEEGTSLEFQSKFGKDLRLEIFTDNESKTEVTSLNSANTSSSRDLFSPENDNIDKHIKAICPIVKPNSASRRKRTYTLPSQQTENLSHYQKLFAVLENEKDVLNIKTFSIYSPSLEEIFLEIIDRETIENIIFNKDKDKNKILPLTGQVNNGFSNEISDTIAPQSPTPSNFSSTASLTSLRQKRVQYTGISLFFWQVSALLMKRFWNFCGDKKLFLMTYLLPLILLIMAMVTALIRPKTETPNLLLTPSMYGPRSVSFSSYKNNSDQDNLMQSLFLPPGIGTTCMENVTFPSDFIPCHIVRNEGSYNVSANDQTCSCSDKYSWECQNSDELIEVLRSSENTSDIIYHLGDNLHPNKWILNTFNEFIEQRYGGWRFGEQTNSDDLIGVTKDNAIVYYNNKGKDKNIMLFKQKNNIPNFQVSIQ